MVVARNYIGFTSFDTMDEFKTELRNWIAQIDLAPGDGLYDEMIDWMDDNIMEDPREAARYEWKTPVNLTVNDDGTITWKTVTVQPPPEEE